MVTSINSKLQIPSTREATSHKPKARRSRSLAPGVSLKLGVCSLKLGPVCSVVIAGVSAGEKVVLDWTKALDDGAAVREIVMPKAAQ